MNKDNFYKTIKEVVQIEFEKHLVEFDNFIQKNSITIDEYELNKKLDELCNSLKSISKNNIQDTTIYTIDSMINMSDTTMYPIHSMEFLRIT